MQEVGKHKAQVVGIFGMGGVGKTTLAKELFNRKGLNYRRGSFLFDVREKSVTSQLPSLQSKLIKDLFGKEINFTSTEEGTAYLKDRLQRNPHLSVLVVVDDIDHVEQLNALMVMDIFKNSGNSLVIVTTRDAGVLITAGITVGYNLKGMDRNFARELFCWHAFRHAHPCSGYEALVEDFVELCGGLPLSLLVLGRHVHGRSHSYWSSELIKAKKTLPRDVKQRLLISFEALDDEEKQVFMDTACFFAGHVKNTAERVWEASGWNAQHALETLKDKCLVEEIKNWENKIILIMHDHLRDLGREVALELSSPHRLWRPQDLKSLEKMGFQTILTKSNLRCFHSFSDKSVDFQVKCFLGQSDSCLETSASLLWLQLEGNSKEQPSIPSWIPLHKLQCLNIYRGKLKTLWKNRTQAPSQLKELQILQTSLIEFPDFQDISDNLEKVILDAGGWPIQGLSLLESLSMNLSSLCLRSSTLKGERTTTKKGERTLCQSLVIWNIQFYGELDWNNGKAPMGGLEKLEISGEQYISRFLISGIHYPSLESIKLHNMENLMEVYLTRVKALSSLDIRNCPKLKKLAATSDLVAVDHFNSDSGVSSFRMLTQLKVSGCQKLEELRVGHLSCLKTITIEKCDRLRYSCFCGMKCLERITFQRNVMVKYFELNDCQNLKTMQFDCGELVEISILGCPELKELPAFKGLSCLERILIDGCGSLKYLEIHHCRNLKSVSGNSIRGLCITSCPELGELADLSRMSYSEIIKICQCEKIQNIRLPTTLISLTVESCRDLRTVAGTGDVLELRELTVRQCPELEELPSLSRVNAMEKIEFYQCEKIQNIRLPTTLISLTVESCRDLRTVAGTGDILELRELTVRQCPELEELPCLSRVNAMEKIEFYQCEKIQNIRLPTTLTSLTVESCRDLRTVAGTGDILELRELTVRQCPELEELPCLSRVNAMEKIEFYQCEKIQNIRLPAALFCLSVESCRDLQTVAGTGDLLGLRELTICNCPKIEELPCLSSVDAMEKIDIVQCEKIQNITLPTTELQSLSVKSCRDLQRVAGTGDLLELKELTIINCPVLEELPSLSWLSCLEKIDESQWLHFKTCVYWIGRIRNGIPKLKSQPSEGMVMIRRAMDGAQSTLNKNLFRDAHHPNWIGVDRVGEIGRQKIDPKLAELSAVVVCFVVAVDSKASVMDVNLLLVGYFNSSEYGHPISVEVRAGEWIITMVGCNYWRLLFLFDEILGVLRGHGIVKKGIWAGLKKDEMWKSVVVLSTIRDSLYHL